MINSTPPVAGVTHKTRSTPTEPNEARGLEPPDPNSGIQLTGVRRPSRKGLEAASHQIELGEKTQMSPNGLRSTRLEVDRVISTFLFDPNLEPSP